MPNKIKYKFHDLSSENHLEYSKAWKKANPNYNRKWRENHPEKAKEHDRKSYSKRREHRIWIVRNCIICGRFVSRYSKKYCKDCGELLQILEPLVIQYEKNHKGGK